jgi:hypothetical protein
MPSNETERQMITKLTREYNRVARLLDAAENRAFDGAGCYSESYAQAEARNRRSAQTIRKHRAMLARLDRQIVDLAR